MSTTDLGGGAEKFAWDLFRVYRAAGHGSWLAVGEKRSTDADILAIPNHASRSSWARTWLGIARPFRGVRSKVPGARAARLALEGFAEPRRAIERWRGYEDFHFPGTWRLLKLPSQPPDIVHAHNLHGGYFDLWALPWLCRQLPVMVTLQDAWMISGHCSHSFDCERWKSGCGLCPDLTIYPAVRRDATASNWHRKHDIFARCRIYVASPSRWLAQKVQQSMLAQAIIDARVIPNGVDLSVFRPAARQAARAHLGLPAEARIVLFTAGSLGGSPWRDAQTMRTALGYIVDGLGNRRNEGVRFVALGNEARMEQIGRASVQFAPYERDPRLVAKFYQAADVYVHPAKVDTFPLSVLEALACGTPVVATAAGGIPEQIDDGRTGRLVRPADAEGLARAVIDLLTNDGLRARMGREATEAARRFFDL
ncbi:MAG: glycosyltransferase, partial [bacterium]